VLPALLTNDWQYLDPLTRNIESMCWAMVFAAKVAVATAPR
jgi:hypothetical protein